MKDSNRATQLSDHIASLISAVDRCLTSLTDDICGEVADEVTIRNFNITAQVATAFDFLIDEESNRKTVSSEVIDS